ncbi:MAG: dephospho-CoA kinase [Proteobacteria bacterium]|nr:dephospho-CoA kinase [Pseudomonadota bacterium]
MVHVIGLTGGIASGKSTVGRLLAARGAAVVDADQLARKVVEPGQPALVDIVARFGGAILTAEGTLDRKRLGSIVFADPAALADLNRITHPRIAEAAALAIATWADAGASVVFYESALLVEQNLHGQLAALIVVAVTPEDQEARIGTRDKLSIEDARKRVAAQAPLEAKLRVATWAIHNRTDLPALEAEVDAVVAQIEPRFGPIRVPTPRARRATGAHALLRSTLVTGFPAFTAKRMIAKLVAAEPTTKVFVLAQERFAADAAAFVAALGATSDRVEILVGDVCDMDLGLSSREYQALVRELTWIEHLAGIYFMGIDAQTARRVNVDGTRNVLDLARDATRLERVVHWSSALLSGDRAGRFFEDDLEVGQTFHNAYERTKLEAEKLARGAMRRFPVTIVRPSIIVGDSVTGDIDKLDGPYYLITLIATNTSNLRLPMLGRGDAPLHLVPIDYVIEAAWHAARSPDAAGKTFHLVDPAPLTAQEVFERVAAIAHTAQPRGHIPRALARAVLRTPGLSRLGRGPLAFMDMLDHVVHYDATNTARALAGTRVQCPSLADYLPVLVAHVLAVKQPTTRPSVEQLDPLD